MSGLNVSSLPAAADEGFDEALGLGHAAGLQLGFVPFDAFAGADGEVAEVNHLRQRGRIVEIRSWLCAVMDGIQPFIDGATFNARHSLLRQRL